MTLNSGVQDSWARLSHNPEYFFSVKRVCNDGKYSGTYLKDGFIRILLRSKQTLQKIKAPKHNISILLTYICFFVINVVNQFKYTYKIRKSECFYFN